MLFLKFGKDIQEKNSSSTNFEPIASNLNLYSIFICHRIPDRTFNLRGYYFPVCSRCTGLYFGISLSFILINSFFLYYTINYILFSALMMIPTVIDGITQFFGFHESNNCLRFLTGLIAGIGLIIFLNSIKWIIIMN